MGSSGPFFYYCNQTKQCLNLADSFVHSFDHEHTKKAAARHVELEAFDLDAEMELYNSMQEVLVVVRGWRLYAMMLCNRDLNNLFIFFLTPTGGVNVL